MKKVVIAIDPGFDGCKMVVNGLVCHIPFMVEDITSRQTNFPVGRSDEKFIRSKIGEQLYLLGDYARKSLLEQDHRKNAAQMDTFYTIGRFGTETFERGLISFIGYGLYLYSVHSQEVEQEDPFRLSELDKADIYVSVALPHQQNDQIWTSYVKDYLKRPIKFDLLIGNKQPISFDFTLKEDNCMHDSQAVSAMLAMVTDDDGNSNDDDLYSNLPCLVIDAGYMTVGNFKLSRDGSVDMSESNQLYAMHNVNEAVANSIKRFRPEIASYNVEELAKLKEKIQYEDPEDRDTVLEFNVDANREDEIKKVSIQLFNHLMAKFDRLLDIKHVIVAGGTGEKYYAHLEPLFANRKKSNLLAKASLNGKVYDSVFAVAIGLYKSTLGEINNN